jgi:hypothetical protein
MHAKTTLAALLAASTLSLGSGATAATLAPIALQGDPAPLIGGPDFRKFEEPDISDFATRRVVFVARTRDKNTCIFKMDPAGPDVAGVCKGDPTPDGREFRLFSRVATNDGGAVAWSSTVSGDRSGIYGEVGGPVFAAATTGDPAPPAGVLDKFDAASDVDALAVFEATVSGAPMVGGVVSSEGVFVDPGAGPTTAVARRGDSVPDRAGREFCFFFGATIKDSFVAFHATTRLDCSDTSETFRDGIFRANWVTGTIVTVALESEPSNPVPTVPGGTIYGTIPVPGTPDVNASGTVVFRATTGGVLSENAVYSCGAGCPAAPASIVAAQGEADAGGDVLRTFGDPRIATNGDVAFNVRVQSASQAKTSIYIHRDATDTLELVARTGDGVPGLPVGTVFKALGQPAMSGTGRLAFSGTVRGLTAPKKRSGIFVYE